MKTFKYILGLVIFLFLACSCSQLFYADFEEDVTVSFNNANFSGSNNQRQQWTNIPHPADGFNIITKATYIAQGLEQQNLNTTKTKPIIALQ